MAPRQGANARMDVAMKAIRLLHLCNEVGLGGTERGIVSFCRDMRYGAFEHTVACLASAGARAPQLAGLAEVAVVDGAGGLPGLLRGRRFDAAVVHRAGGPEERWSQALQACHDAGIAVIVEINIFGLVDTSPADALIDSHLHISKSSWCAFRERAGRAGYSRTDRHRVLYIPTDVQRYVERAAMPGSKTGARAKLGLRPDDFVLLRTGRPDPRKWSDLLLDVLPRVSRAVPASRFVFLSAPPTRAWYMKRQPYARSVRVLPPTADDDVLADTYAMSDVYMHSSRRGESFGVSLVEAMAAGLPVVVDSTPWRDNAQIEVVDHGVTGIVANSGEAFADAVIHLYGHPEERVAMGGRGREKALETYDSKVVCRSMAGLLGTLMRQKGLEPPERAELRAEVRPTLEELESFRSGERGAREQRSWGSVAPSRARSPLRRLGWTFVDACEIGARRAGLIA